MIYQYICIESTIAQSGVYTTTLTKPEASQFNDKNETYNRLY